MTEDHNSSRELEQLLLDLLDGESDPLLFRFPGGELCQQPGFEAGVGFVDRRAIVAAARTRLVDLQRVSRGVLRRLRGQFQEEILEAPGLQALAFGAPGLQAEGYPAPGFQADTAARANAILARLRTDLGHRLERMDGRSWDPLMVVDFPAPLSPKMPTF